MEKEKKNGEGKGRLYLEKEKIFFADEKEKEEHCQRHDGPEG